HVYCVVQVGREYRAANKHKQVISFDEAVLKIIQEEDSVIPKDKEPSEVKEKEQIPTEIRNGSAGSVKNGSAKSVKSSSAKSNKSGSAESVKNVSAKSVKTGSAKSVKTGSAKSVKTGSAKSIKSGSAGSVKSGSAESVKKGSARSIQTGSAKSVKSGSAESVKSRSAEPVKKGSAKSIISDKNIESDMTINVESENPVMPYHDDKTVKTDKDIEESDPKIVDPDDGNSTEIDQGDEKSTNIDQESLAEDNQMKEMSIAETSQGGIEITKPVLVLPEEENPVEHDKGSEESVSSEQETETKYDDIDKNRELPFDLLKPLSPISEKTEVSIELKRKKREKSSKPSFKDAGKEVVQLIQISEKVKQEDAKNDVLMSEGNDTEEDDGDDGYEIDEVKLVIHIEIYSFQLY
ncbi:unnamed protein product, partial [Owenia fusiformis]